MGNLLVSLRFFHYKGECIPACARMTKKRGVAKECGVGLIIKHFLQKWAVILF